MVRLAQQEGIKPVARIFGTTPKTVRKWLRRYQQQGYAGLRDQSRAPKQAAGAITPAQKRQAIRLKKELPSWGAGRIKRDYELALSEKALRRIWREQGLLKKKRRKHKTKNDLRAIKQQWRLFEQISMDTKDLNDIPELWPQIRRHGLPTVQYTAREVVSGLQFIGYAQERSLTYARLFARLLVDYLQSCGVSFRGCRIQTDNGAEFVGSWNAQQDSAFTQTVQSVPGLTHQTIPPGAHTWQADVETVHRIIEDELYEVETFSARDDFLQKATTYNLWFNLARKNSYKNHQSPWEIVKTRDPTLAKEIVAFPPLFLDELFVPTLQDQSLRGYDLIPHPSSGTLTGQSLLKERPLNRWQSSRTNRRRPSPVNSPGCSPWSRAPSSTTKDAHRHPCGHDDPPGHCLHRYWSSSDRLCPRRPKTPCRLTVSLSGCRAGWDCPLDR